MEELIRVLAVVGFVLFYVWRASKTTLAALKREGSGAATAPDAQGGDVNAVQAVFEALKARMGPSTEQIDALAGQVAAVEAQADETFRRVDARGWLPELLRPVFDAQVAVPLLTVRERMDDVLAHRDRGAFMGAAAPQIAWVSATLTEVRRRTSMMDALLDSRADRASASRLDDADAVARAFIEPLSRFAQMEGISMPVQQPIALPSRAHAAAWPALLPEHPVVAVPRDFDADLFWWTSVPHELAHVAWLRVPGLAREFYEALGLGGTTDAFDARADDIDYLPHTLATAWAPELFADWMTVLMAGPAAVHGMVHVFEDADVPTRTAIARVAANGRYDEHPPAHLRVLVACAVLERMGFLVDARVVRRKWEQAHPELTHVVVETADGRGVRYEAAQMVGFLSELSVLFYDHQFAALSGHSFQQIPGLEMTSGLWARANRHAKSLVNGTPFHDDPRVIIAAAIEARHRQPSAGNTIRRAVRDAIVGVNADAGDRRTRARRRDARPGSKRRFTRAEFRDALVLRDVAERRRPGDMAPRRERGVAR